ncbi:unnamed protein product [Urochloa humidicola]
MSHFAESSGGGRARSRLQGARSSHIPAVVPDPVADLSGFPLIVCSDCGLSRVVEGRTKKDGKNHGRLYFKCARNAFPKLCGYYRFEKAYFQHLKDRGIIVVHQTNEAQFVDEEEQEDSVDSPNVDINKNNLEQKLENLIWKMNMFIVCFACVALGCVVMYAVMK